MTTTTFDKVFEFMLPHFLAFSQLRNYNNYIYVYHGGKWILFDTGCHSMNHVSEFCDSLPKQTDDEAFQTKINKTLHNIVPCKKFINKVLLHLERTLPNTAENENECSQLPTDDMFDEMVTKVVNQVLLPDEMIIQKLSEKCPDIVQDTMMANTCLKYARLYATNDIIWQLRLRFTDEMKEKKVLMKNDRTKYTFIRKEDEKHFTTNIYFNKKSFTNWGIVSTIFHAFEDLFVSELQPQYRESYWNLLNRAFCYGSKDRYLYCNDWESFLPVLLSDKTNYLTKLDRYVMAQFPVWMEHIITQTIQLLAQNKNTKLTQKQLKIELRRIKKIQMR